MRNDCEQETQKLKTRNQWPGMSDKGQVIKDERWFDEKQWDRDDRMRDKKLGMIWVRDKELGMSEWDTKTREDWMRDKQLGMIRMRDKELGVIGWETRN